MAHQRDKKVEEPTELHAPEITLCANSCGFPGNPATKNLCQTCFLAASSSTPPPTSVLPPSPSSSPAPVVFPLLDSNNKPRPSLPAAASPVPAVAVDHRPTAEPTKSSRSSVNRCHSCRKRVGLTGFRCRCGELFCGAHRYSDRHDCSFDYKSVGRDAIARENPVVRAAKIVRF
ncbi:hypothetical protein PR202_gb02737 [Eleusine coracana subsp. coracana]|uniref:Uncharacterized protein n=1 Tax=Eleusine coracana subsp. coracana TaxID=191504 RepID=A0AAV5DZT9_ELECO|nr:hypothetical protein QOZ80_8BG0665110 [Eleusine coracana subsp. coracana]GJN15796.1 hypothetical protein PR202_gb02737 [Eleusine coracana subsp. coracana]